MAHKYLDRVDNVQLLDTNFFGFPRFNAAYLVRGEKKTALIDTGDCNQLEAVRKEMARIGVTMKEIDYIFVTHCEHTDHAGNAGYLAQENPDVKICINPLGESYMTHPEIEAAERQRVLPPGMADRFGKMLPIDPGQMYMLEDGEEFDLGGDTLKVIFAPGHQPSGLVIEESRNKMLFINDLCGQYFAETDVSLILTPDKSSQIKALKSLQELADRDYEWLALGHFGFCDNPRMVMHGAISRIERLLGIAEKCYAEGRAEQLWNTIMEQVVCPEMDKIRRLCEEPFYLYYKNELGPNLCNGFTGFYKRYMEAK